MSGAVVLALGNADRGDDGVGLAVADRLRGAARVEVVRAAPPDLFERWAPDDRVVVIDAACSGAPPGTVHRFDALTEPLPAVSFRGSTHAMGLGEAIELARTLDRLPAHLAVVAIEGAAFDLGAPLSPEVAAAVGRAAEAVREELSRCTSEPS